MSLQISKNLSLGLRAFRVSLNRSDYFDSVDPVFVYLKTLKGSAECAVTKVADNFVLTAAALLRPQDGSLCPHKVVSVLAAIYRTLAA